MFDSFEHFDGAIIRINSKTKSFEAIGQATNNGGEVIALEPSLVLSPTNSRKFFVGQATSSGRKEKF